MSQEQLNDFKRLKQSEIYPKENSVGTWSYCNMRGDVLFVVDRFNNGDSKSVIPRYFSISANRWENKLPLTETPLYNLETMKEKMNLPVLFVEGEKTAEAAKKLFGKEFWVTTWHGGSNRVTKAKIIRIHDRTVYLFPDNDEPGHTAMNCLATSLFYLNNKVHIVQIPKNELSSFEKGWDLADDFPQGWTKNRFKKLILEAPVFTPPSPTEDLDTNEADDEENIFFTKIEPFPEPVNGQQLISELRNIINTYVFLPPYADIALCYWILFTYGIKYFEFSPRLAILSPEKRCGKSTLLDVLTALCYRPINLSNTTTASMFRLIEQLQPTMLLDEADTFLKSNEELRGIINSGHRCNGQVTRVVGDKNEVKIFRTFSACAIASIGTLPDTIMDRSIIVSMKRATKQDKRKHLRLRLFETEVKTICEKCLRFMCDNAPKAASIYPDFVDGLSDRAFNNWEHLFAIADIISPTEGIELRTAAIKLSSANSAFDTESITTLLLRDIREIFNTNHIDVIQSTHLCSALANKENSSWGEISYGKPITPTKLSHLLHDFNIKSQQRNVKGQNNKVYYYSDFIDAFNRYLGDDTGSTLSNLLTTNENNDLKDIADEQNNNIEEWEL